MDYTRRLTMLLPLPFRRGEGRGDGSLYVVYPAAPSVSHVVEHSPAGRFLQAPG